MRPSRLDLRTAVRRANRVQAIEKAVRGRAIVGRPTGHGVGRADLSKDHVIPKDPSRREKAR